MFAELAVASLEFYIYLGKPGKPICFPYTKKQIPDQTKSIAHQIMFRLERNSNIGEGLVTSLHPKNVFNGQTLRYLCAYIDLFGIKHKINIIGQRE